MTSKRWVWGAAFLAAFLFSAAGCSKKDTPKKGGEKAKEEAKKHDHPHEGPHEGAIAEWGEEEFHVEFTVDHPTKQATIYVLDGTAKKAPAVAADKITDVKVTISNLTPPVTIDLKHDAAKSDAKGIAFVGTHEQLGKVMEFKGNISGKVNGKAFSGDFEEKPHDHKEGKK